VSQKVAQLAVFNSFYRYMSVTETSGMQVSDNLG